MIARLTLSPDDVIAARLQQLETPRLINLGLNDLANKEGLLPDQVLGLDCF